MRWLFLQHISDISAAMTVVAQTDYFVGAVYFDIKLMNCS